MTGHRRQMPHHHPIPPIPDSYWVIPQRLLAGEYPGSFYPDDARAKLRLFLDAGVNYFVDLTFASEPREPYAFLLNEEAAARGVTVIHERLPIPDGDIPTTQEMTHILDAIDAALHAGRTVYVHCWGGHGRTGTVVGCHFVRHGMTAEQALAEVARLHATTPGAAIPSPQTLAQCDFVRHWPPGA